MMGRLDMKVEVVVPDREEKAEHSYTLWVGDVKGVFTINEAVKKFLDEKHPGWKRAYVIDPSDDDVISVVFDHQPRTAEKVVMELIGRLGDVVGVPFFEWIIALFELNDAPRWTAGLNYPVYSAEVEYNETEGVFKAKIFRIWPEKAEREAEVWLG